MPLGPWNTPPNFLGAMQAGANAGISLRGQDISAREAQQRQALEEERLTLGEQQQRQDMAFNYARLAQQEKDRQAQMAATLQQHLAANMLRQSNIDMLAQWHQGQLENTQAAQEARQSQNDILNALAQGRLDEATRAAKAREEDKGNVTFTDASGAVIRGPLSNPKIAAGYDDFVKRNSAGAAGGLPQWLKDAYNLKEGGLVGSIFRGEQATPDATNAVPAAASAPAPAAAAATNAPPAAASTNAPPRVNVKIWDPNKKRYKFGTVPATQLPDAMKEGYIRAD